MTVEPRSVIERAIDNTRKHAYKQLAWGGVFGALMIVWPGAPVLTVMALVLDAIVLTVFGRRAWRLRRHGPVVRALLDVPGDVQGVSAWPDKLPANRMPLMLDIHTHEQQECSLLLDPKDPAKTHDLVHALQVRSPDAIVNVPLLPAATTR